MIVHDMTDEAYHSRSELSSTGARLLLPEYKGSPQKFQYAQTHRKNSRAFDVGTAAHAKVLGSAARIIVYPPEHLTPSGNVSTKAATLAWETEQYAAGLTPVSPGEVEKVNAMAEAVLAHESAGPLFEIAVHREVSVFAEVDGVPMRARFDALSDETRRGVVAVDLKTGEDATPDGFTRAVKNRGYDVQEAHYEVTYHASEGRHIDEFWWVVVEKSAPYEVAVYDLEEMWVAIGRAKAEAARRIYQQCMESGVWPGYDSKPKTLTAPAYVLIDHEMNYESGDIH